MKTIDLTRKQLYDLVWSTPLTQLALQYAITNKELKELCLQFEIPMPANGHWLKLKYNKPCIKTELNAVFDGEDKIVLSIREEGDPISKDQSPLSILTKQIESDAKAPLTVPDKLTRPDILIPQTNAYLKNVKNRNWDKIGDTEKLSIDVEYNNRDRAFRLMDTFIKLLKYRKHTFKKDSNNWGQICIINGVEFPFRLREVKKRIPAKKQFESATYLYTGIYVLKIDVRWNCKEWKDGTLKLEQQLAKIVADMEIRAQKDLEWQEKSRLEKIKLYEEKKIEEELLRRKKIELTNFKTLLSTSERFDKAIKLRNYINRVEEKAINNNTITDELNDWLKWAKDKIDWYDPLISKQDELLDDIDINEIENPKQTNYYYR